MNKKPLRHSTGPFSKRTVTLILTTAAVSLMLGGCGFPRKDFSSVPDPSIIRMTQHNGEWRAHAPDCRHLLQPSQYNAYHNMRLSIAFGCATYSNLAASVARPADLVQPPAFAGTHADPAALAVERYRLNDVEPLRDTTSTSSIGR